jgi:tetratricopeptide (TPR) repeat protein
MTNAEAPGLPPPSPEHRRVAAGQFERANQVVATGNYDYGIHLLLGCCKLDPASLPYRQALRRTEKAKYHNNLRGSRLAWLLSWPVRLRLKAALRRCDYLKALEYGEHILVRNPWDVPAQMDLADAAEALGLLDLAVWNLEQARQKQARDPTVNRALARLYEKRGNFTQAIALWGLVLKARPADLEVQQKIKDLAAHDTIARAHESALEGPGRPGGAAAPRAAGTTGSGEHAPAGAEAHASDPLARDTAPLRARLQTDPTNPELYRQLAKLYRRANQLEQAHAVLREGLGPTGNAFELSVELADLEIEPFRRNLAITEDKLKSNPDDPQLRKIRHHLRKEVNTRELELYRQKAERHPGELSQRFEFGVRLLRAGQLDEAIRELQAARADPRLHWQALLHLGHCFKARNNWRLAERNFEEALQHLPPGEMTHRKELLFELANGLAESGDLSRAVDLATELANLDFGYRDIGQLLDDWQQRLRKAGVSG